MAVIRSPAQRRRIPFRRRRAGRHAASILETAGTRDVWTGADKPASVGRPPPAARGAMDHQVVVVTPPCRVRHAGTSPGRPAKASIPVSRGAPKSPCRRRDAIARHRQRLNAT